MCSAGVPALQIHLAFEVVHAAFALESQGQAVRGEGPLRLMPAGEAQVALLVAGAGGALRLAPAEPQGTVPLIALRVRQAMPSG